MNYIIIVILIMLSAFFSATETAFSSVNKIRLKHLANEGNKRAEKALHLQDSFDKVLTTILVGNNIVNICSASLATVVCNELFAERYGTGTAAVISTVVMTVIVLIFGEITPKSFAKESAEKWALFSTPMLSFFMMLLAPVTWLFMQLKKAMSKLIKSSDEQPSVTEDELKYIIDEIEDEGVLEEQEGELVRSALEFDETSVEQILIPRVKVVAVEKDESIEKIKEIFLSERYSRLPVYENTIDNIIGIIHEKDFFKLMMDEGEDAKSISGIIQKAIFISEMRPISEILREMQKNKIHMAIVKDQYGGTSGIVTLEDIIEELVGEIYDENDEVIPSVVKVAENTYEISAELSVDDMLEELELPEGLIESESNSVGGWVIELFGHIPEKGETIKSGIFTVTVAEASEQSVSKVRLEIDMPEENKDEEE